MALFRYKAVNNAGQIVQGTVEAANLNAATEAIEERKLTILRLLQTKHEHKNLLKLNLGRVSRKDIVVFSRQLAVMLNATVPIVQSLRIMQAQTSNPLLKTMCRQMADDVDGGLQMSAAFAKHPQAFSRFYVAMIRSGETSGRLDEVLTYLADQMEKDYDLVSRIRGAMIYPIFIISALVAVGIIMMVFIIPRMGVMLQETGAKLPMATRILIGTSNFMINYWWLLAAVVIGGGIFLRLYLKTKGGRVAWDNLKLRIPIFGMIVSKIIVVRMTRSLSTLIRGGVPIGTALQITSEVVDNAAFRDLLEGTIDEVRDGNSITTRFSDSKLVPKIVSEMMSIGEQTGKLDDILDRIATFYDREVSALVANLTALIEPMIMVLMGVGVAMMVAAVLMPMFEIANSIS